MEDIHVIRTGLLAVNTLIVPIGKETPKKVFVVDPATSDFSRDTNKVVEYLQKNKLECVGILLTHTHFDHIMGVKVIKDAFPNAKIAVPTTIKRKFLAISNHSFLVNFLRLNILNTPL